MLKRFRESLGNVERDGHRPEEAIDQMHIVADGFVVITVHEASERREAAIEQQLEIAELSRGEVPGWEIARGSFRVGRLFSVEKQVDEFAAVR